MEIRASKRDQFLALGDNSLAKARTAHCGRRTRARPITPHYFVNRDLLIGKALFIYWPHALDHIPGTSIWFPLFPNFERMRFIR